MATPLFVTLAALVAATSATAAGATGTRARARPNFLILFVDDLGYNEINLGAHTPPSGGYVAAV